ncbi:MAG: hypothetical protein KF686_17150 [Ramlibacter sp.]|nr:hypothetical protein [Ramlibacter sp.]
MKVKLGLVIGLVTMAFLSGCAPKPPGCDAPQVAERLQQGIPRDGVKLITDNIEAAGNWQRPGADQLRAWLAGFGKSIKVELATITSDGYDSSAKRHACTADLTVKMEGEPVQIGRMQYSIQGTADGKDFVLALPQYQLILSGVSGAFGIYYEKQKAAAAGAANSPVANASSGAPARNFCVEDLMNAWKRNFDARQQALMLEAESEKREFRPISPVQEEAESEAELQRVRRICPPA